MPDREHLIRMPGDYTGQIYRRQALAALKKKEAEEKARERARKSDLYEEDLREVEIVDLTVNR